MDLLEDAVHATDVPLAPAGAEEVAGQGLCRAGDALRL